MRFGSNKGFSLIEVMVATTILMIIVIMVGNIFRHSSSAWETGYSTTEGASGVRSVLGSVQRELAQAIDGREYGLSDPIDVEGGSITFYRYVEPSRKGSTDKELQKIKYTFSRNSVTRSVDGKSTTLFSKQTSTAGNSNIDVDFDIGKIEVSESDLNLSEDFGQDKAWTIPSVWVRARVTRSSAFAGMEARSYGPDGKRGTEDDIIAR